MCEVLDKGSKDCRPIVGVFRCDGNMLSGQGCHSILRVFKDDIKKVTLGAVNWAGEHGEDYDAFECPLCKTKSVIQKSKNLESTWTNKSASLALNVPGPGSIVVEHCELVCCSCAKPTRRVEESSEVVDASSINIKRVWKCQECHNETKFKRVRID